MLFFHQIKKDFQPNTWKKGQLTFRENKVQEVRLKRNLVQATIQDDKVYQSSMLIERGSIITSNCTCSAHSLYEKHCKHVAALASWVLERGSLLKSGISGTHLGMAIISDEQKSKQSEEPAILEVEADPVAFVRGIYQGKVLQAISIEPALRYKDPFKKAIVTDTFVQLIRDVDREQWKNTSQVYLKPTREFVPILHDITSAKMIHQGATGLDQLAKILADSHQSVIVYHENLQVKLDPHPLRLASLNVGKKRDHARTLTYEFRHPTAKINSEELEKLSALGLLSPNHVLKDGVLYRFEKSLTLLSQYANRSGIASSEGPKGSQGVLGYAYLHDDEDYPLHPLTVYRLSLEMGVEDFNVDPDWKDFYEWKKIFEKKTIPELPHVDFGFELREYQTNGVSWMWSLYHRGLAALLADDMGLGKTHQVMAILTSIYSGKNKPKLPTLVVAPTSVVSAWIHKLEKYETGLKWTVFHGKSRVLPKNDVHLVLTTYGILQREAELREREWHIVILDEAQAIKNAITISSRASRVLKSKYRIAMTGTPIENHATDLWSIMEFLIPGYLGSLPRFKRLYGGGRDDPNQNQISSLKRLISPFLLRRTKDQVLKELPEKTEEIIHCELTSAQKKAYKAFLNSNEAEKARAELEGGGKINYANILALLTRLKQVCDHPKLPDFTTGKVKKISTLDPWDSGKWTAFDELLNEALGSNLKVVVFSQYLGMMDIIAQDLERRGVDFVELRGDTPDRSQRIKRFAADDNCKVFLCSLLAGSLGIDLTAASVCIHIDRWWNPARENQATDRLHRIGQTRGVQVFKLQIPGTIEDRIASIIQSKTELSDALIEQSALGLKAFSRDELLQLLSINPAQFDE
jgi:superfamily II DNA or RNA helicase